MNNICVSGANVNFKAKPIKPANIKRSFVNTSNDFMELSTTKNKSFLEYYYEYMDLSGEELDKLNKIYKDFIVSHPDHKDKKAHMTLLIKDGVFNKNQTFDVYSLYFDNVEPAYMGVYSGNSIIWEQTESQLEFIKKFMI